jgi:hypothetical protein
MVMSCTPTKLLSEKAVAPVKLGRGTISLPKANTSSTQGNRAAGSTSPSPLLSKRDRPEASGSGACTARGRHRNPRYSKGSWLARTGATLDRLDGRLHCPDRLPDGGSLELCSGWNSCRDSPLIGAFSTRTTLSGRPSSSQPSYRPSPSARPTPPTFSALSPPSPKNRPSAPFPARRLASTDPAA